MSYDEDGNYIEPGTEVPVPSGDETLTDEELLELNLEQLLHPGQRLERRLFRCITFL